MLSWKKFINQIHIRKKVLSLISFPKRVSFSLPFYLKAGMTLEGCLVIPFFLFFMGTLLYSLEMVRFQSDAYEALHQVGSKACFWEYESAYGQGSTVRNVDVEEEIKQYLNEQSLPYLCVEDGSSGVAVSAAYDKYGRGNIAISIYYAMKPFIRWLPIGEIRINDGYFGHSFIGYTGDNTGNEERAPDIYVYITPHGSKYHFSEDCTYLKVQIKAASAETVNALRNRSGEKYYPCEYCEPAENGLVYVTEWGNRYHGKSDCPTLKRTVYIIPLSEAGTRTACSKCG